MSLNFTRIFLTIRMELTATTFKGQEPRIKLEQRGSRPTYPQTKSYTGTAGLMYLQSLKLVLSMQ